MDLGKPIDPWTKKVALNKFMAYGAHGTTRFNS